MSLDGASTDVLHQLYREGALTAGGFSRFWEQGQTADGLVPVDPSLTATNHISLASGYAADRTGIVSNTFHVAGTPFLDLVSGFEAAVATETLWEAARRQGRRVGIVTWPGADDTSPRRRADWGLTYVNGPDRQPELITLDRASWKPAGEAPSGREIESRSPVLAVQVQAGSGKATAQRFDLLAVDRTDDGKVDYDGLVVLPPGSAAGSRRMLVEPGRWADLPCQIAGPEAAAAPRGAVCTVKLLELAPDLARTRIYFGGVYALHAYPDELAAALAARGLFWPGPPDDRSLGESLLDRPGIDLETWIEQSDRFTRFFGDNLVAAAQRPDWDLLMGYVPVIDTAGHQLQLTDPRQLGFSAARRDAFAAARRRVWQAVDRELARVLAAVDLRRTVVVLVSDHGMAPVHTLLDANVLLREKGLLAADAKGEILEQGTLVYAASSGAMVNLYVAPGHQDLLPALRELFTSWTVSGERPVERALTRTEAAEFHLDNPNSGDLILFLREGYTSGSRLRDGKIASSPKILGAHGYLHTHQDMHGIYLALGAGIGPGNAGTVQNVDVAGRVAAWLGIEKPRPVQPVP